MLVLFAVAASNSIAATQAAWVLGLLFWICRFAVWPRPDVRRTPIDYAMLGFFILTGISSVVSYEPMVSIGKLRGAVLFTIVYLFAENIRSTKLLRALAIVLIAACMINVFYTFGQFTYGRGVKVHGVRADSPLAAARWVSSRTNNSALPIFDGDTLMEVDGYRVRTPEQVIAAFESSSNKTAKVTIYRLEWTPVLEVPRGRLLPGATVEERLGIQRWSRGRDWRARGFFSHMTTYAEALQLIASLALGLLIALPRKRSRNGLLLGLAIAGMCGALFLTITRASWLAFLVSVVLMSALGLSRRALVIIGVCALPVVLAGLFVLHQKRNVGFFDQSDASTTWRQTIWREGFHLLTSNPRHLLVGVGMDSIKSHWRGWGLFDGGRLPTGHMHNDYLEIALERGVPALAVWLILLGTYGRMLWRLRRRVLPENWIERGIVLGALGGLVGFMLSGIVHYNWGDSEVVMIFFMIMGMSLVIERQAKSD